MNRSQTMSVGLSAEQWQIRASLYELLALSFAHPQRQLAEVLASGEYQEAVQEISAGITLSISDDILEKLSVYYGAKEEEFFRVLRQENTRLFVGSPQFLVAPYETIWRAKDEGVEPLLFVSPHAVAVKEFYRRYGVGAAEGKNEPLDNIVSELEFLQYIASLAAGIVVAGSNVEEPEESWAGVHNRFIEEHASVWVPRFAEAVAKETDLVFFEVAANLLSAAIDQK